jgi:hypothetical protein
MYYVLNPDSLACTVESRACDRAWRARTLADPDSRRSTCRDPGNCSSLAALFRLSLRFATTRDYPPASMPFKRIDDPASLACTVESRACDRAWRARTLADPDSRRSTCRALSLLLQLLQSRGALPTLPSLCDDSRLPPCQHAGLVRSRVGHAIVRGEQELLRIRIQDVVHVEIPVVDPRLHSRWCVLSCASICVPQLTLLDFCQPAPMSCPVASKNSCGSGFKT